MLKILWRLWVISHDNLASRLLNSRADIHMLLTPALFCHKDSAAKGKKWTYIVTLIGSFHELGPYAKSHCERQSNLVAKLLVGGFGCLELCPHGIREQHDNL